MKELMLTNGLKTKVDDEDHALLSKHRWQGRNSHGKWYVGRVRCEGKKRIFVSMPKEIVECPAGMEIDHINGDSLDNQKGNLRVATHAQNMANRKTDQASGYRGVNLFAKTKTWIAQCNRTHLGYWKTPEAAAQAYNAEASRVFGEFAVLNDLPGCGPVTSPPDPSLRTGEVIKKSKYRGIFPRALQWGAVITLRGKRYPLGLFRSEEVAAAVYDAACDVLGIPGRKNGVPVGEEERVLVQTVLQGG